MAMPLGFIARNDLEGLAGDVRVAQVLGYRGLEFNYWGNFRELTAETIGQMRLILDRGGVRCASLGLWGFNHLAPEKGERDDSHALLSRAIDFAQTLGADVLITGGGDIPGASLDQKVAEFARVFPPFLDRMAAAGLRPCMYAVHGNSFFDSMEAYDKVIERFPQIRVKFDPANWLSHGHDPIRLLRDHGRKIGHMHIKESLRMDGRSASEPAAGMGDVHWGKVMAFLYEADYDGWLIVEPHGKTWESPRLRDKMLALTRKHMDQFLLD